MGWGVGYKQQESDMRFIPRGPDIPDNLLFAHEEGRAVFFCGAGISMGKPARLPSFKDLVKRLFEDCSNAPAWKSRKDAPLDQSLTWLEDTVPGKRKEIIGHVYEILNPDNLPPENSPIHEALLALARPRNSDATMLVTTNFDRLFERCHTNKQPKIIAPRLPIPKPNHWHEGGVVYLHGLIHENPNNDTHKDNLILTSGDFGRAYLSERWAARFVTELFRNYVVCFVGYSLNDPVMRYLSDALANDRKDGIRLPEHYIFVPERKGRSIDKKDYPGLEPIPYPKTRNHHLLRDTLKKWVNYYNDKNARKRIIQEFIDLGASSLPHTTQFRTDPGIGRFMWALRDKDAAEYFSMMHPRPPLEIINVLKAKVFGFDDLVSFRHSNIPTKEPNNFQKFSLLEPKIKFEDMSYWTISDEGFYSDTSPVPYFYKWIARHVDRAEIALWVAQRGGSLNVQFKDKILRELIEIREPDKHPDSSIYPIMYEIWELIFSDDIYDSYDTMAWGMKFDAWIERYQKTGLNPSLKRELELITQPKVKLSAKMDWPTTEKIKEAMCIEQIFEVEIDLVPDHGFDKLKKITLDDKTPNGDKLFYIDFFHSLLRKIFTLADNLCEANGLFLGSSDNDLDDMLYEEQEHVYHEWHRLPYAMSKLLIEITKKDKEKAKAIVMEWLNSHYIFINRIGLHCLHESPLIDSDDIVNILLNNDAKLLKNIYARSQVTPLLKSYATQFSKDTCRRIQMGLLAISNDSHYDHLIIAYLRTLQNEGVHLLEEVSTRFEEIKKKHDYSDSTSAPKPTPVPSIEADIQKWAQYLEYPPKDPYDPFQQNLSMAWSNLCEKHPRKAFEILKLLNIEKDKSGRYWPWQSFFGKIGSIIRQQTEALSDKDSDDSQKDKLKQSNIIAIIDYWLYDLKERDQVKLLLEALHVAESSLQLLISSGKRNKQIEKFMNHAMKLLTQYPGDCHGYVLENEEEDNDILFAAMNNPIGYFVALVMQYQILTSPQYRDGLLPITKQFFEKILSDKQLDISRFGLCLIARRLIYLFSYDKKWVTEKLIPCFSWDDKVSARAAWSGYLAHARWTPDLIESLSDDLLTTADHIVKVNEKRRRIFAHLIGSLALYETDILPVGKLRECVEKFDGILLFFSLGKIRSSLETIEKDNRSAFWQRRIEPFFKKIWPNDASKLEADISHAFEDIILMEGNAFPHAVEQLAHQWAEAIRKSSNYLNFYFRRVLECLNNREHAKNHPQATINLLYEILGKEIIIDEKDKEIWEKHILVHLEPLNDKRLESIKKKIKWK